MSIRRRNINQRLGRDLQYERGSHEMTRALLRASQDLVGKALAERDGARRERDRLFDLAAELARYFASDPPAPLSRETDLFLLLQEMAPMRVPALPPTQKEMLETVLDMAGVTMEQLVEYAHGISDSIDGSK